MGRKTESTAWRWEWHACTWVRETAQTHCHNSLPRFTASFQLPKSSRTTDILSITELASKTGISWSIPRSGWVTQVWVLLIWKPHSRFSRRRGFEEEKKDWERLNIMNSLSLNVFIFNIILPSFNVAGIPQVKYYLLYLLKRMNLQYFAGWVRYIYSHPTIQVMKNWGRFKIFFLTYSLYLYSHFQDTYSTNFWSFGSYVEQIGLLDMTVVPTLRAEDSASLLKCHHPGLSTFQLFKFCSYHLFSCLFFFKSFHIISVEFGERVR